MNNKTEKGTQRLSKETKAERVKENTRVGFNNTVVQTTKTEAKNTHGPMS